MRIGLLTTSYPAHPEALSGRFVFEFAETLRARGHDVEVMAPAPRETPSVDASWVRYLPGAWRRTFHRAGVPDNLADPLAWPGLIAYPAALLGRAALRPWDAIVSHFGVPCALAGALIARGRPHLAVWHSADVHLASSVPGLARLARRSADQHWVVSAHARDRLGFDAASTIVAPMGADPGPIVDRPERAPSDPVRLLFMGRQVPIKGLDMALRASRGLNVRWDIAGDGPERARWSALAASLELDATFHGAVHGDFKQTLLERSDVFVVPSRPTRSGRVEGAPVALLEAQLAGLPVLASRSGALPERVRDGVDGWLVDPQERAWRAGLLRLLDARTDWARYGAQGRAQNLQFSWDALAPRIEAALVEKPGSLRA